MTRSWRLAWLMVVVLLAIPLLAFSQHGENNRARLAELRKDTQQYARILQRANEFLSLPVERQQQLRRLDRELHRLPESVREDFFEVMNRYAHWLAQLPQQQQQDIENAATAEARLQLIRTIKQEQWKKTLPRAQQRELAKLTGKELENRIAEIRREQLLWELEWQISSQHWQDLVTKRKTMPARLDDLPEDVQIFVKDYLEPLLSEKENQLLQSAEGQWPLYPCTLVALADRHPITLPGPRGPKTFTELPQDVQDRLRRVKIGRGKLLFPLYLREAEGKWPDFAVALTRAAREKELTLPVEFWPTRSTDLSLPVRSFLNNKLLPILTEQEADRLQMSEGVWPLYPETIQKLAHKYYLQVPWQTLPPVRSAGDRRDFWDRYRVHPQLREVLWPE